VELEWVALVSNRAASTRVLITGCAGCQ